jgi:hypothetical protein
MKKTLKQIIGSVIIAGSMLFNSCESDREKPPKLKTPWVILTHPRDGATVDLNPTFSWKIMNVKEGETYKSRLYTDKGMDPLDNWYEDCFGGPSSTATNGTGIVNRYDDWYMNDNPDVPSINQSLRVSLDPKRYSGKSFCWAIKITDSQNQDYYTYSYNYARVKSK